MFRSWNLSFDDDDLVIIIHPDYLEVLHRYSFMPHMTCSLTSGNHPARRSTLPSGNRVTMEAGNVRSRTTRIMMAFHYPLITFTFGNGSGIDKFDIGESRYGDFLAEAIVIDLI